MPPDPASAHVPAADAAWDELDLLLGEAARLSKLDLPPQEFHARLLQAAVAALAACGGAVWLVDGQGRLQLGAQLDYPHRELAADSAAEQQHAAFLAEVLRAGEARTFEPGGGMPWLLVAAPVLLDREPAALLEVFQRSDTPAAARLGYVRVAQALAGMAADFHRSRQWREFRDRAALAGEFEQFSDEVHRTLDPTAVAFAVANEGRRIIGCDRVSVAVVEGRGVRLLAVSGSDAVDRRAAVVRRLEDLAAAVCLSGQPVVYVPEATGAAPEVAHRLEAYLDAAHARSLAVVPLSREGAIVGALAVERFEAAAPDEAARHRLDAVARQAASALGNALAHRSVPLVGALERLSRMGWYVRARGWPKLAWTAAALGLAAAALALIPADFELEARGELQPQRRRDVFAPCDALISQVEVAHGDEVAAGQVLLVLRRPELEVDTSRVLGELQTARQKLAGIQAARLTAPATQDDRRVRQNQLTAEEEEVKQLLASLEAELTILRAQAAELRVRAPLAGMVTTWDVEGLLSARPVARGQRLLSVAQTAGEWVLEVRLPDHEAGHLFAAQAASGDALGVTYLLATDPSATYTGRLQRVALHTEPDEKHGPHVLLTVDVARDEIAAPRRRPGATVIARIDCGRRALGYVWCRRLYEAVRRHVWL